MTRPALARSRALLLASTACSPPGGPEALGEPLGHLHDHGTTSLPRSTASQSSPRSWTQSVDRRLSRLRQEEYEIRQPGPRRDDRRAPARQGSRKTRHHDRRPAAGRGRRAGQGARPEARGAALRAEQGPVPGQGEDEVVAEIRKVLKDRARAESARRSAAAARARSRRSRWPSRPRGPTCPSRPTLPSSARRRPGHDRRVHRLPVPLLPPLPRRTIDEVLSRYAGKVRSCTATSRSTATPQALPAARAARCAGEQGKFWEYHRSLMIAAGRPWTTPTSRRRAATLKLDAARFGPACLRPLRRGHPGGAWSRGTELGVTGTPTFFVNGRLLVGRPAARGTSQEVIDERARRRGLARTFLWTSARGTLHSIARAMRARRC